jgi:hypothetical protein
VLVRISFEASVLTGFSWATITDLFWPNAQIEKQIFQFELNLLEVDRFILGQDGFTNSQLHIYKNYVGVIEIAEIK